MLILLVAPRDIGDHYRLLQVNNNVKRGAQVWLTFIQYRTVPSSSWAGSSRAFQCRKLVFVTFCWSRCLVSPVLVGGASVLRVKGVWHFFFLQSNLFQLLFCFVIKIHCFNEFTKYLVQTMFSRNSRRVLLRWKPFEGWIF